MIKLIPYRSNCNPNTGVPEYTDYIIEIKPGITVGDILDYALDTHYQGNIILNFEGKSTVAFTLLYEDGLIITDTSKELRNIKVTRAFALHQYNQYKWVNNKPDKRDYLIFMDGKSAIKKGTVIQNISLRMLNDSHKRASRLYGAYTDYDKNQ